ncbi:transcriptional regulator [Methylobacterium sp. Leaf104]|nr:transcriptional regulator [Methylobacterium sp. Leaf104]MCI9881407.1 bifunctional proline dehydrogenase/L-glutamate gamma-semialdehyde dehydrogenase PutA [Methylobacterium goesingense]
MSPADPVMSSPRPFGAFLDPRSAPATLRRRLTAETRAPEPDRVAACLDAVSTTPEAAAETACLVHHLVGRLRAEGPGGGVQDLLREYALSTHEGVALMCLAEALLRIPDAETRDALIRDKIGHGDWAAHLGHSPSLFVNAATWGLVITGRLAVSADAAGLSGSLTRLVARGGEPLVRAGVHQAMRLMGGRYVCGETIGQALRQARRQEARGFTHSFDMLGEAAMDAADAARYAADYTHAIHTIGAASAGRGPFAGPGISIKLSALHPRYVRAQRDRVMTELLPRVAALARLARRSDIGLNIDAEEADRLDLSLDILEALCADPALGGWDGLGFVVQAYQKRALTLIAVLVDLARRSGRRLMVRLVKGAYWDSEIKRAQVAGLEDFPVFTRKVHTDLSYRACAERMLAAPDALFPQFATHNAQTVAALHTLAGPDFQIGRYEFQCLHGMGEALYDAVVGPGGLDRPCRIYAPVGTHATLLAYLVRRLLENGANSSFVNRVTDARVAVADLAADPVALVRAAQPLGAPHPAIRRPRDLFPDRPAAPGLDLADEQDLADLAGSLAAEGAQLWRAVPMLAEAERTGPARDLRNPADRRDRVGTVVEAGPDLAAEALAQAGAGTAAWAALPGAAREAILVRAAAALRARRPALIGLLVREAGKSAANALAEVREAEDFLRYYAGQARDFAPDTHRPLGTVACISPWNFPLAIFTGQVAAALAAGNGVLAKPAEETPLVAAEAVRILRAAGVPAGALQLLPGGGETGAALVADPRVNGVLFTGSSAVAAGIRAALAGRLNPDGHPVPLVAETGGLNALVADSSALPEQVVADTLVSAFDSAGQRCSALRLLALQEDIADRTLAMLKGALAECRVGNPDRLATDIGPVIGAEARDAIEAHVAAMRAAGYPVHRAPLPDACDRGHFVAPTVIEIPSVAALTREVFGPVLHVVRFERAAFDATIAAVNATGYGLTFGVQSRLDAAIARACAASEAGNLYVNRNLVGAVVGVQPFGGHGLSGTGPKAGGPLILRRLLSAAPAGTGLAPGPPAPAARAWVRWLREQGRHREAEAAAALIAQSPVGGERLLPGPVGEENRYGLHPRGTILCRAETGPGLAAQVGAALATGNRVVLGPSGPAEALLAALPRDLRAVIGAADPETEADAVLWEGGSEALTAFALALAARPGPLVAIHRPRPDPAAGTAAYPVEGLVRERVVSHNTAAAGGNASLMALED